MKTAASSRRGAAAGVLFALGMASTAAQSAEQPLWEAGAGVAILDFPDYRGADERHTLILPIPYFVYRGDFLKADRESIRGQFYKDDRFDLHLSINGTIPVDSGDNAARSGMPDLDPTLEIGPNLTVNLLRTDTTRLNLRFPLRAVLATDLSYMRDEGWVFQPQINVDFFDVYPGPGWNLGFAAGPIYGSHRYHNYFYGVASQFATATRAAYDAPGGYAGMQGIVALSKRYQSFWVGAFVRGDSLAGAVFNDSPLVKQQDNYSVGIAFAWIFSRSSRTVNTND